MMIVPGGICAMQSVIWKYEAAMKWNCNHNQPFKQVKNRNLYLDEYAFLPSFKLKIVYVSACWHWLCLCHHHHHQIESRTGSSSWFIGARFSRYFAYMNDHHWLLLLLTCAFMGQSDQQDGRFYLIHTKREDKVAGRLLNLNCILLGWLTSPPVELHRPQHSDIYNLMNCLECGCLAFSIDRVRIHTSVQWMKHSKSMTYVTQYL